MRSLAVLLLCLGAGQAASTLGICTGAGGTLGGNLFDDDGTFGTLASASPASPSWPGALPAGRTTLKYISNTTAGHTWPGNPEDGEYTTANSTACRTDGAWWSFSHHTGAA